jgi:hypothetical protein
MRNSRGGRKPVSRIQPAEAKEPARRRAKVALGEVVSAGWKATYVAERTDITPIDAAPLPVAFTNEATPNDAEGGPKLLSKMNLPNEPPLSRRLLQPAQLAIL